MALEGHPLHAVPLGRPLAVLVDEDAERELDRAERALEVMRDHRHQLVARPRRLHGRLVQERMVDRGARAASDFGGEGEVPRAVAASGLRGDGEEDRPEGAAAGDHRHGDGRQGHRGVDHRQAAVVAPVACGRARRQLGLPGAESAGQRMIGRRGEREIAAQPLEARARRRVAVGGMRPSPGSIGVQEDDDAVVGHLGNGEADRAGQRLVVVDGRVEGRARVGEEAPAPGGACQRGTLTVMRNRPHRFVSRRSLHRRKRHGERIGIAASGHITRWKRFPLPPTREAATAG